MKSVSNSFLLTLLFHARRQTDRPTHNMSSLKPQSLLFNDFILSTLLLIYFFN